MVSVHNSFFFVKDLLCKCLKKFLFFFSSTFTYSKVSINTRHRNFCQKMSKTMVCFYRTVFLISVKKIFFCEKLLKNIKLMSGYRLLFLFALFFVRSWRSKLPHTEISVKKTYFVAIFLTGNRQRNQSSAIFFNL